MKVIKFTIPVALENSVHVQEDILPHFYEHLHRHNEAQITWVISGEGTLIAGNSMQRFQSGDLYVIGADQPHLFKSDPAYFTHDKSKRIHSLNLFFNPKGPFTHLLAFPEMRSVKKFVDAMQHGMQAQEQHAERLISHMTLIQNSTGSHRLAAFIELLQAMADLKNWKFMSTGTFEYAISDSEGLRMNDIYQYTMANFTENISLEQVASVVYLTPQSFCRYFKKHTSKTYVTFLNEIRINEACKKFMDKEFTSISAVAYQSGFNNVVTFNRVFKSITKKSPREFLKTYHKKVES